MASDHRRSCRRGAVLLWAVLVPSLAFGQGAALKPPTGLVAQSATKSEVGLSWNGEGGNFIVERKPLGGTYSSAGRSTAMFYSDQKIEQFATYVYRVRSFREVDAPAKPGGKDLQTSAPSNEITVGPPPVGFSLVVKTPAGREDAFGKHLSLALDANGDPCVAYNFLRADGPDSKDAHLFFAAWDRATYRWKAPVKVDTPGEVDTTEAVSGVSLAGDAGTSVLAIAYQKGHDDNRGVSVATSIDGGATWKTEVLQPEDDGQGSQSPSIVLVNGTMHVTYVHNGAGLRYRTRAGAAGSFTNVVAPVPGGHELSRTNAGMALDASLQPAMFYWYNAKDGPRSVLAYWRPGQPSAVEALDSPTGSDDAFAWLAFAGTQPRFLVNVRRDDNFEDHLWFTSSTDGRAWTPPARMPKDTEDYWAMPLSLAFDSKGHASAFVTISGGRGATLGRPKMLRSDDLRTWRVWSPDTSKLLMAAPLEGHVTFAANDKQYVVFRQDDPGRKIPAGINLWREP